METAPDFVETKQATDARSLLPYTLTCAGLVAFFVAAGLLTVPLLGFQTYEVIFVHALWLPKTGVAWFSFYHRYMPSMLMSYVGGLKSWLYAPLLLMWTPSVWLVRVPLLLLGALTIAMVGRFLFQVGGRTAAVTGVALLSLDCGFPATSVFDWGPVVLQNLLLIWSLLLVWHWYRTRGYGVLFSLGIVTGLALWNKALFVWNLSTLLVAGILFGHRQLREALTGKTVAILLFGFLLGAYPLLRYNLKNHGLTMGQNAHLCLSDFPGKVAMWRLTLDGSAARDALVARSLPFPDQISRPFGQGAVRIANAVGIDFSTWGFPVGSVLLVQGLVAGSPLQRRWIGFFLLSCLLRTN